MINYSLASVKDVNGVLEVIDVVPNNTVLLEPGVQYEKLSALAGEMIENLLREGKRCAIPKGLNREIMPEDIGIREAQTPAEFEVILGRSKLHDLFTESLLVGNIIQYYNFTEINNYLIDAGYAIHNGNKEEKYIEILETGDDALITKLETYLEAKDILNILSWKMKKIEEYEEEVKVLEDPLEVSAVSIKYFELLDDQNENQIIARHQAQDNPE